MSKLFTPFKIGKIELKNRLIRSATTSYWSTNDGLLTEPIFDYYEKLAKGGVGLIIKGHSYINDKARAHQRQSGLCNKEHVKKMKELTEIVHKYETPIIAQLNHGGYYCRDDRISASKYRSKKWQSRQASIEEIKKIINDFANSAELAIEAGFDGVQIHAAHGYLISQFLSDIVNKRKDEYGGSLENRARLLLDVYSAIRDRIGKREVVGVKINCDDFANEGGFTIEQSIQVMKWLSKNSIDFIEISGGGPEQNREIRKKRARYIDSSNGKSPLEQPTFGGYAIKIKKEIKNTPLSLVDGIRTKETMDALLDNNIVDLVSMSKPFIIEPDFPAKMKNGQSRSACIDCLRCLQPNNFGKKMLRCFYLNEI
ncbi:MAG: NADH:flavin oxidoreductase [Candidatus Heimdallarchaeum aukensis]|uniref:NADH:flavin oxidoreductase n=1 Tax=Candidatus Heimdallarchaeum aukensis TaxID=2876573 RepID=A0A9Y1BL28_9ARCH|nr:MAG: NADH:flavin oxidoreductase [Candidatus Heimdallarchaeum aukensis]